MKDLMACINVAKALGPWLLAYLPRNSNIPYSASPFRKLSTSLLDILQAVEKQLRTSLDKQQDILSLDVRKQLLDSLEEILNGIFKVTGWP